ncbi:MAG: S41 family peptidase [Eubacterium sp.]|uniref:S41 family peptidase n=1 Tax=Eubacterium sp. TaxID=142586 RepID=UPI003990FF8A
MWKSESELENGLYGFRRDWEILIQFITKAEYKELQESTSGTFYGIGAYVQQKADEQYCTITKVFENGPADKAGMKANDIVTKVDNKDVTGQDIDKVVSMMRGDKGTQVVVQVFRSSEKKYKILRLFVTKWKLQQSTTRW